LISKKELIWKTDCGVQLYSYNNGDSWGAKQDYCHPWIKFIDNVERIFEQIFDWLRRLI
jgi:hypothetical protein